jgi:hypothetical protein
LATDDGVLSRDCRSAIADRRRLGPAEQLLGQRPRSGFDRAGHCGFGQGAEGRRSGIERGLAPDDLFELLIELFLIEQLPACRAIDAGAQFGDAILVGILHFRLPRDQARQDIVTKGKIGCRCRRPRAEQRHRTDNDPEHLGSEPHLLAGVRQRIAAGHTLM